MSLTDKALLVQLNASQWSARKLDQRRTEEIAATHGVASRVGRYNKDLLPSTDMLSKVIAKTAFIRNYVATNTLPWGMDGTRILPAKHYHEFQTGLSPHVQDWEQLVDAFVAEYPRLVGEAQAHLRDLFDANEYPDASDIRGKFRIGVTYLPLPSTDFRVSLGEHEIEEIRRSVEERLNEAGVAAQRNIWDRLLERVDTIKTKMADPSAIFHSSLIEGTRELCDLVGKLNYMNDPQIEEMRNRVYSELGSLTPDVLRTDPVQRQDAAASAAKLADRMRAYIGAGT